MTGVPPSFLHSRLKKRLTNVAACFSLRQHRLKTCATKTLPYCQTYLDMNPILSLLADSARPTRVSRLWLPNKHGLGSKLRP
jgi:hypothetical protein